MAFASTLKANRTKFQPRARTCAFHRYLPCVKGYKLLDLITREVFISRDVVFHGHLYTFHYIKSKPTTIDPFLDIVISHTNIHVTNIGIPAHSQCGDHVQPAQESITTVTNFSREVTSCRQ